MSSRIQSQDMQNNCTAQALKDARLEQENELQTCGALKTESLLADSLGLGGLDWKNLKDIDIHLDDLLFHKPLCLGGRATAVLCASDDQMDPEDACKISCLEIVRESEGKTIEELCREIDKDSNTQQLSKHLPAILMCEEMSRYGPGTQLIRSMSKISVQYCRILRALVSRKSAPLTSLIGAKFVKAWLEVVKSHAFLWSQKIEYGDPSLWNVMYNEDLKCGVLSDYDLSISRRHPRIPATGTIPFMAVNLLSEEYWNGKIERLYRHELEAFIWILPFFFLRYKNGKAQRGTPVERWMSSNYHTCRMEKNDFWTPIMMITWPRHCPPDFKDLWPLAQHLLLWCSDLVWDLGRAKYLRDQGEDTVPDSDYSVASLWPLFVGQLRQAASRCSSRIGFIDKLIDDLELERPFWV